LGGIKHFKLVFLPGLVAPPPPPPPFFWQRSVSKFGEILFGLSFWPFRVWDRLIAMRVLGTLQQGFCWGLNLLRGWLLLPNFVCLCLKNMRVSFFAGVCLNVFRLPLPHLCSCSIVIMGECSEWWSMCFSGFSDCTDLSGQGYNLLSVYNILIVWKCCRLIVRVILLRRQVHDAHGVELGGFYIIKNFNDLWLILNDMNCNI
jgi:hypothetical protein